MSHSGGSTRAARHGAFRSGQPADGCFRRLRHPFLRAGCLPPFVVDPFDFPVSADARINFDIARKLNSATAMTNGSITIDTATRTISGGGTFDGNWNPAAYKVH